MAHIVQFEHLKIPLEDIKAATDNFAYDNCIGQGGFGKVYTGNIIHSAKGKVVVALKRLDPKFGQGDTEFWKEIMMLSNYRHENIVSLLGYCDDSGEKILAYEYASKRSLDLHLANKDLNWAQRLKICLGAARGLEYLHAPADTQLRVLHRDIKSSNILLDENWIAKISDFGLSKFGPANKYFTYLVSNAVGTLGYCDPLYAETGFLTKESDVYSFGVVLFEILCGRLCVDNKDKHRPLVGLARESYEKNIIDEIIFDSVKDDIKPDSLNVFTEIAYQCLNRKREERPLMTQIVEALETALKHQCPEAHKAGILNVKVLRTMDLKRRSFFARSRPYVILKLTESSLPCAKKTKVKDKVNPEWHEEFTFYVDNIDVQRLNIWVLDAALEKQHNIVGMAFLLLENLTPEYQELLDLYIFNVEYRSSIMGNIVIEVVFKPLAHGQIPYTQTEYTSAIHKALARTLKGGGVLVVIVHEARSLQGMNHMNPHVLMLFKDISMKTKTMTNNKDPIWEEVFTFMSEQPPTNETLQLKVISSPMRFIHSEV
ncbi:C2 domain-containing protein [Artemisia annua]|uniref:non-specific serine/threonine protein kinase n=1 Tax=Artemisia annua TaxID=35608 RepID=A0A2U1PI69_ARTAN|nr:C2 domain-containing protein [Artemisia annua]